MRDPSASSTGPKGDIAISPVGKVAITAIVTAYRRIPQTVDTLRRIQACHPACDQILVHVDGGESSCAEALRAAFPGVEILESQETIGPGGGRNKLIAAARNELVASFDDDSYPADGDFFERSAALFERFPAAALIGCAIFEKGQPIAEDFPLIAETGSFVGAGVVYRRNAFLEAGGYVPLPIAYAMEEEDLSLRLLERGRTLLWSPWLRVFHNTDLAHHRERRVTAAQIANVALLAFLRYPKRHWPYGVSQVLKRAVWSVRNGRAKGVADGIIQIPVHLWRHKHLRRPVSPNAMHKKWRLREAALQGFDIF
jgi:GT2 family glycosyltransferase